MKQIMDCIKGAKIEQDSTKPLSTSISKINIYQTINLSKRYKSIKPKFLNTLWHRTKGLIEIKNYKKKWGYFESKREEMRKPTKGLQRLIK